MQTSTSSSTAVLIDYRYPSRQIIATLGIASAAALVESVLIARQVLILILVAAFIAVGLDPAVRWLVKRGLKRGIAVLVIILATLGFSRGRQLRRFGKILLPPVSRGGATEAARAGAAPLSGR